MHLFSRGEWTWCLTLRNLHACGYHAPLHHQSKQGVSHVPLKCLTESARPQTYSFPWIYSLEGFLCSWVQLLPKAIPTLNQFYGISRQRQKSSTFFFFDRIFFGLCFCIQFRMETWFRLIKYEDSI